MCNSKKFVQVHCHSDGSQLDGVASVQKLVAKAKEFGHPALALTDHGNSCRLFDFAKECKKNNIKPILGLEFYICNDLRARVANKQRDLEDKDYHQSTYIKNKEGYRNFCELTYRSFTDGYYYKPRIDFDSLFELKNGLMITSSCMASKTSQYILRGQHKDAEEMFKKFLLAFDKDFYGEIQFNEVEGQKQINDFVIHLCKKYDVPILIGGDVHYATQQDNVLQDAVIRSKRSNSTTSSDDSAAPADWAISARHLYYHDVSDYYDFNKKFGFNYDEKLLETCFENSIKFSEKTNFEFETGKYHLPKIKTEGLNADDFLEKITWEGIAEIIQKRRKHGEEIADELIDQYEERIVHELSVIKKLGIADYLLIVGDIINWEKKNNFYVGPGRGSAAGSAVAYAIGITGLCPIKNKLLFERFINPERKVMPDIDWDSEQGARDHVLQYLVETYGQESVCNVVTFGLYGPKSALQDMSRGLKKDTKHDSVLMKKITKLEGLEDVENLPDFFNKARRTTTDPEIKEWIDNNQDTIDFAQRLQGQMRQLGTHAGGILVTPGPVYNYIPVTRGSSNLVSAFKEADGSSKDLSELGLLKLDVLGLKTLNILKECVTRIKEDTGQDLTEKIYYLDINDKKILDFFGTGNNYGIFQMDRAKMFTDRIKVDSFDDIVAINAINRPGPLEKFLDKYGYWKSIDKGELELSEEELEEVNKERYPFKFMETILKDTYGCLLYQEQFMLLVKEAGGFDLGEADNFRRCIGWVPSNPKYYQVEGYFKKLEAGMAKKGYNKEDTEAFIKYCKEFLGYSFNRSHSAVYAYVAFQTLYFKVYYPAYFYAAMLNAENDTDVYQEIIADARKSGIKVLPHNIIKSRYATIAEDKEAIRLGFGIVKGMGGAVELELNELKLYECKTMDEVLQKPFKKINTTQLQNLIDLGCFDDFGIERNKINVLKDLYQDEDIAFWFERKKQRLRLEVIPKTLKEHFNPEECLKIAIKVQHEDKPGTELVNALIPKLKVEAESEKELKKITVKKQKELLGFSLFTDNLITQFERALRIKGYKPLKEYKSSSDEYYFSVVKNEIKSTKNGKSYLQLVVNDGYSDYKVKCWSVLSFEDDKIYSGKFKKDDFGWTLEGRNIHQQI